MKGSGLALTLARNVIVRIQANNYPRCGAKAEGDD